MKQTEKLQQQLKDDLTLVIDETYSSKYAIQNNDGELVVERTRLLKSLIKKCSERGLLK